ncbi:DUF3043 domain-containing protein [Salinactinospora qingdaonensis]|uniref:DUF3043 domain-containing protein n=1 Tax=Salinactinospora qingdaonensis TaxID=702744 RepID=UPI0031E9CB82
MFRRRSATPSAEQAPASSADTATGKGYTPPKDRPTPRRKEAEKNLRRPLNAPKTRKEAYQQYRERQRRQAQLERQGYARGDERYFRPQDRGPQRAFVRDLVDSRRSVSEFFLYLSLGIIVLLFLPFPQVQLAVTYIVWPLMMVTIVFEGFQVGIRARRSAAQHFPDEPVRGVAMYAAMRQLQIRRLRMPKPRLKAGDPVAPGT